MQWDAQLYEQRYSFVWKHGEELIALLDPQAGERILDAGCGTGRLTAEIARSGAAPTGLDSSAAMIEQARTAFPEVEFVQADLLDYRPERLFDGVFSNAALHWIPDAQGAARSLYGALRPGGRLVAELGGTGNVASLLNAVSEALREQGSPPAQRPWYFPTLAEYASVLEKEGFEVVYAMLFDRPTPLEGGESGLRGWLRMFGQPVLPGRASESDELLQRVEEKARPGLFDPESGSWTIDYRRLRIAARKPLK